MTTTAIPGRDYLTTTLPPNPLTGIQLAAYPDNPRFDRHPGVIRVTDNPVDETADVLDFDGDSPHVTMSDLAPWAIKARANYDKGTRPGQRRPCILVGREAVTGVVNELIAAGITSLDLWITAPGLKAADAEKAVVNSSGPFPTVAFQFSRLPGAPYCVDFFSAEWLSSVSGGAVQEVPEPAPRPVISVKSATIVVLVNGTEHEFFFEEDD